MNTVYLYHSISNFCDLSEEALHSYGVNDTFISRVLSIIQTFPLQDLKMIYVLENLFRSLTKSQDIRQVYWLSFLLHFISDFG